MSVEIDFSNSTNIKINQQLLEKAISTHLKNNKNYQISLSIVPDAEIKKLNKKYRNHNCVTDVLSFSTDFPKIHAKSKYLGDIVIAYPFIKKQAQEQHHSLQKEVEILTVHGLNHLQGKHHDS